MEPQEPPLKSATGYTGLYYRMKIAKAVETRG